MKGVWLKIVALSMLSMSIKACSERDDSNKLVSSADATPACGRVVWQTELQEVPVGPPIKFGAGQYALVTHRFQDSSLTAYLVRVRLIDDTGTVTTEFDLPGVVPRKGNGLSISTPLLQVPGSEYLVIPLHDGRVFRVRADGHVDGPLMTPSSLYMMSMLNIIAVDDDTIAFASPEVMDAGITFMRWDQSQSMGPVLSGFLNRIFPTKDGFVAHIGKHAEHGTLVYTDRQGHEMRRVAVDRSLFGQWSITDQFFQFTSGGFAFQDNKVLYFFDAHGRQLSSFAAPGGDAISRDSGLVLSDKVFVVSARDLFGENQFGEELLFFDVTTGEHLKTLNTYQQGLQIDQPMAVLDAERFVSFSFNDSSLTSSRLLILDSREMTVMGQIAIERLPTASADGYFFTEAFVFPPLVLADGEVLMVHGEEGVPHRGGGSVPPPRPGQQAYMTMRLARLNLGGCPFQ